VDEVVWCGGDVRRLERLGSSVDSDTASTGGGDGYVEDSLGFGVGFLERHVSDVRPDAYFQYIHI
jgi:hypothetical protein